MKSTPIEIWRANVQGQRRRRSGFLAGSLVVLSLCGATAAAAAKPRASRGASAAATRDAITLKTGGVLLGWVKRYAPDQYVILQMETTSVTVAASEILSVAFVDRGPEKGDEVAVRIIGESKAATAPPQAAVAAAASAAAPSVAAAASPAVPATAPVLETAPAPASAARGARMDVRTWLDSKKGTLGRATTGPDGSTESNQANLRQGTLSHSETSADGREASSTELNALARTVSHEVSSNCSSPADPACRESAQVAVGVDGVSAELHQTSVVRVQTPPHSFRVIGIDTGVTLISGDSLTGLAGQVALSLRYGIGGQLPGPKGGGWSGLGFDIQLGATAGKMEIESDYASLSQTYSVGTFGTALGYQYLHFGELDEKDLKQGGFGLFLGYRLGLTSQLKGESEMSFSHGPQVALSFPSYNAGTASVSDFVVKGMILPTGDLLLAAVTLGFGF